MKQLAVLMLSLFLISCGGGGGDDARTTISLSPNSASLGDPNAGGSFLASNEIIKDEPTQFSWSSIVGVLQAQAQAQELTARLFQGVSLPNLVTFSQTDLAVLESEYLDEVKRFQNRDDDRNYSDWLQTGVATGTYISPGHLAYGLLWSVWLDERDLRRKIYQSGPSVSVATNTGGVFAANYAFEDNNYFIGWLENAGSLTIRSVFQQNDSDGLQQDAITAIIATDTIQMNILEHLTSTSAPSYTIALIGTKDADDTIQMAVRMHRSQWQADIDTATLDFTNPYITLLVNAQSGGASGTASNLKNVRVDYAQCPTSACDFTTPGATGTVQYAFNPDILSRLDVGATVTLTLPSATLALPSVVTPATIAAASDTLFLFDVQGYTNPE